MPHSDFDFETLRELAVCDPLAYFRQRERIIAEFIDAHPDSRGQLIELQRRIDGLRAVAGTPRAALRGIFSLLEDRLRLLAEQAVALQEQTHRLGGILDRDN